MRARTVKLLSYTRARAHTRTRSSAHLFILVLLKVAGTGSRDENDMRWRTDNNGQRYYIIYYSSHSRGYGAPLMCSVQ
jgi:hypothetical protein